MAKEKKPTKEPTFEKEAIVRSARYRDKLDLVNALLEDEKEYTLKQVDEAIEEYLNKEVK